MGTSAHEANSAPTHTARKRKCSAENGLPAKRSQELILDPSRDGEAKVSGVTTRAMRKRLHHHMQPDESVNPFDGLCDDLVLSIFVSLSSRARAPSHLIAVALTCKRFRTLAMQKSVLAHASKQVVAVRASVWCKDADNFVRLCADSGNVEACFTLGMIKFYCMGEELEGVKLLGKAALAWHGAALFALAIIQFNGSGSSKASDKDARAGVALCVRAALAGSVEALRELGHCFNEGHGLPRDAVAARQLLLEANRKEAVLLLNLQCRRGSRGECIAKASAPCAALAAHRARRLAMYKELLRRALLSDYGCPFPLRWLLHNVHPAHLFMVEWFAKRAQFGRTRGFRRVCSHALCGRPETRPLEFRQCAVCSCAFYCSRSCQSMDWKLRHMVLCRPALPSLI